MECIKPLVNHRLNYQPQPGDPPPIPSSWRSSQVNFGQVERTDARAFDIAWLGGGIGERVKFGGMNIALPFLKLTAKAKFAPENWWLDFQERAVRFREGTFSFCVFDFGKSLSDVSEFGLWGCLFLNWRKLKQIYTWRKVIEDIHRYSCIFRVERSEDSSFRSEMYQQIIWLVRSNLTTYDTPLKTNMSPKKWLKMYSLME